MPRLYKVVGLGTFLHAIDLALHGISSRMPTAPANVDAVMPHVARGTTTSPFISLTRSYGVAQDYDRNAGRIFPTRATPAYVYAIDIPDPPPTGMAVIDPVIEVARHLNPLASPSYHHDGDMNFLLGVVDPNGMAAFLNNPVLSPAGSTPTPRPANLTIELETIVRALRDAEVLVLVSDYES